MKATVEQPLCVTPPKTVVLELTIEEARAVLDVAGFAGTVAKTVEYRHGDGWCSKPPRVSEQMRVDTLLALYFALTRLGLPELKQRRPA